MSDPIVQALAETQQALADERARNEQLVARLNDAAGLETAYQRLIQEQLDLIRLLEGDGVKEGAA